LVFLFQFKQVNPSIITGLSSVFFLSPVIFDRAMQANYSGDGDCCEYIGRELAWIVEKVA
jgi:hypothetical protein